MEQNKLRRLNLRLSQQEWDKIHRLAANSTCRSTSEYARKVLAQKPVKVFYRNQSFDNFEEQMVRLLAQLETASKNLAAAQKIISTSNNSFDATNATYFLKPYATTLLDITNEIKTHIVNLSDNETKNNELQQHSPVPDL